MAWVLDAVRVEVLEAFAEAQANCPHAGVQHACKEGTLVAYKIPNEERRLRLKAADKSAMCARPDCRRPFVRYRLTDKWCSRRCYNKNHHRNDRIVATCTSPAPT